MTRPTTDSRVQPQPPLFGKVEDRGGIDVLWYSGLFAEGIARAASLDKIYNGDAANQQLIGKVVRVDPPQTAAEQPSPAFDAVVLEVFKRQQGGDGDASDDRVLIQLLSNNAYAEFPASSLTRLDNR